MIGVGSEPREGYRAGNGAITGNQVLIRMSNLDVFYLTKPTLTRLLLCCCTSFPIQSSLEILVKKKKKSDTCQTKCDSAVGIFPQPPGISAVRLLRI